MQTFVLQGQTLAYVDEYYNNTRHNERCVEVAVAKHLMARAEDVLEVGCVMPHYGQLLPKDKHVVVDLYEPFPGVINESVLTYEPNRKFDLVLSISTLDHLHSPQQVIEAIERMRSWRTVHGLLLITLPFGQPSWIGGGPWLDALLLSKFSLGTTELWRMDKTDPWLHLWEEVPTWPDHPPGRQYNGASAWANSVYFLLYGDVKRWWNKEPIQREAVPSAATLL